jgi:hypothetical protein
VHYNALFEGGKNKKIPNAETQSALRKDLRKVKEGKIHPRTRTPSLASVNPAV